ncbi:hypothetical protein IFM89_024480 [Coptis chinensis]|uniref:Rx N-terminal domain-containing protein n=1 Tax=Coptis chinensis TaxID=261450 RepID=A0A835LFJ5_9MAGN|nr:hypothetical protein IFM89_024480 [Coptis chinensis]
MADILVSPIVELLGSNLTSLISTEFGLLYGVKKDLEKLSSTLDTVRSVLDDAETKQIKDKLIGDWLRKLKDAAYEAENIMDDCALEFQRTDAKLQLKINNLTTINRKLETVEILNLKKCRNLKMLPKNLSNMRKLRKLEIGSDIYKDINNIEDPKLTHMPLGIGELTCLKQLSTFVVSQLSDSVGIQELEKLNHLEGILTIKGLQYVPDPRDAYKANLRSKENLLSLHLKWPVGVSDVDVGIECNNSKEVLEALKPHANVKQLCIYGYPGVMLPGWVGSSTALPKLTFLGLFFMPNVEGWSSECLLLPSCLDTLILFNCPKLKLSTPLPSSITDLSVGKGNDPSLKLVEKLPNLSVLRIMGFDEVETLPEAPLRNLTRLRYLDIYDCDKLKRLPTEHRYGGLESTIQRLGIHRCGGLESLTEGLQNLTSLKELRVYNCRSLKSLSESSLQHLTALEKLIIMGCQELEIMLVDFQHLISLKELELAWLPQLMSLPEEIQHARRLQALEIEGCKNLRKLPEWLLELPALTSLCVINCHPELHRRCEDWNRIPHLRVENHVEL